MKLTVWMAQNKQGEYLCRGNMNAHLSYHLCYSFDCGYLCHTDWLMYRTKWEIEEHIRKWHRETRLAKQTRCRAVKMIVSWEPEKEGASPCK